MSAIDYSQRIPNNVDLAGDRRLQRALEAWQPAFQQWWAELGPARYQDAPVYLRTAVDVGRDGWAHFDHVLMPDYRWGIFLSEPVPDRRVGFGELKGEPVWQEVPGEFRTTLQRLIVVQGDTEPASVEQQRLLGLTAPSLYDLRNLFQINVEEGRHLWAMVYLLHAHFGRSGREEADELLLRHSGHPDNPRILGAFNEATPDWLSFFMFTYFTDRDGKYQLGALRESAFDPLARTCDFMLKEEAHHMFVGNSGISRVVQRTAELMREHDTDDVRPHGGLDLAAPAALPELPLRGLARPVRLGGVDQRGRLLRLGAQGPHERGPLRRRPCPHRRRAVLECVEDGRLQAKAFPALSVVNQMLRLDYVEDCQKGVERWNRVLEGAGIDFRFRLPHQGFGRHVGFYAGAPVTPDGELVDDATYQAGLREWLPTDEDRAYVAGLMQPCLEPGRMAGWIAPPSQGINGKPVDYTYVQL